MLCQAGIPELFDCFLLSSSGFTTRALKDLIDHIAQTKEPVRVFAMIDADAHGSMIYQTLVKETEARKARNIEITNLGLFPWEALAEGLQHETGLAEQRRKKKDKERRVAVADYIKTRDLENSRTGNPNNEPNWENWLQDNRVELNAMTSPQRVAWVERKLSKHNVKKVIPPDEATRKELLDSVNVSITDALKEEVLKNAQAWIDQQTRRCSKAISLPSGEELRESITEYLAEQPQTNWKSAILKLTCGMTRSHIERAAKTLLRRKDAIFSAKRSLPKS
jgi:5S rRNA maturation endonuclease (ribonuclease M5)